MTAYNIQDVINSPINEELLLGFLNKDEVKTAHNVINSIQQYSPTMVDIKYFFDGYSIQAVITSTQLMMMEDDPSTGIRIMFTPRKTDLLVEAHLIVNNTSTLSLHADNVSIFQHNSFCFEDIVYRFINNLLNQRTADHFIDNTKSHLYQSKFLYSYLVESSDRTQLLLSGAQGGHHQ